MPPSITKSIAAVVLIAAIIAALVVLVHVPPVRARVLAWSLGWLRSEYAIAARVDRASYNLLAGEVHLEGVTAAAVGSEGAPFLAAGELHVKLPWSVLRGALVFQSVDVRGLRITIVRRTDGSLNLPSSRGSGRGLDRLDIGRLSLRDTSVTYRDEALDWSVEASGISATLLPQRDGQIAGLLTVATGPLFRVGQHQSLARRLQGQIAFDGTSLSFNRVAYEAPEGQLDLTGRLDSLLTSPRMDMTATGDVDLLTISPWLKLEPAARGTVAVRASVTGRIADPAAAITAESNSVSWRHLTAMSLRARATIALSGVALESATVALGEGALTVRGQAAFDRDEGRFRFEWSALPSARLLGPFGPFPVAARLRGSMDFSWDGAGVTDWQIAAQNEAEPVGDGRRAIRISGRESFVAMRGQWRLRHAQELAGAILVTGEATGRLSAEGASAATLAGTTTISVSHLARAMPVLRAAGMAIPGWLSTTDGTMDSDLRLSGTIASPSVAGTAHARALSVMGVGPAQIDCDLAIDAHRVSIERLDASLGGNRASASGWLDLQNDTLTGTASLMLPELARLTPSWPADWQPSGTLNAELNVGGSLASPTISGNLDGHALALANQHVDELTARIEYARGSAVVSAIDLRQLDGGRLAGAGEYTFATGAYALETSGRGLTLQPVGKGEATWPIEAVFDVDFQGQGTTAHPRGGGRIGFDRVSWRDVEVPTGEADVTLSDLGVSAIAKLPALAATINGTIGWTAPWPFTVSADLEDADLGQLARQTPGSVSSSWVADLQGRADLTAAASGTVEDLGNLHLVMALRRLEVQANHAGFVLVRPSELQYARSHIEVDRLELRSGTSTVTFAGRLTQRSSERGLQAALTGDLRDLKPWLDLLDFRSPIDATGRVVAHLSVSGSVDAPILAGGLSVEDAGVAISELPAASHVSLEGALAGGVIEVSEIGARWQGASLTGHARIPVALFAPWFPGAVVRALAAQPGEAALVAHVDGLTKDALAPFVGSAASERFEGTAAIAVDLHASGLDLEQVRGFATIDSLDLKVAGVPLAQVRPTRLELASGRVRIADWTWDAAGSQLIVSGGMSLMGSRDMDVTLAGLANLRVIGAFVADVTTGGFAEVEVRVHGPATAPAADGTLQLRDGELRVADPQIAISDVTGRVVLEGQRLRLVGVEGSANGGRMTLSGEVRHKGLALTEGTLAMAGRAINLNVPQGLRTEVDADLSLALAKDRPELSGTVTIRRGAYREPLSLAAGFVAAARQRAAVAVLPEQASWLDRIALNVGIASTEDLIVDNNYGRMDLGLDVRLVGTVDRPSVLGRAAVREGGVLYLGGRVYQIESGLIDFTSQTGILPDLNITARTRISGFDITLAIAGTPDVLEGTLSSNPPMAQSDIVSLLMTGRMAAAIGGAETTIAREQVLGYLSGEVLGFAAQAVGLDTLRLERGGGIEGLRGDPSLIAGEVDPSSRLTLSKNFSRYVEVVLSQDLRESGHLTWIVSYRPQPRVELRAVSRDDRSRSYGLNHEISFGAPPTSTARQQVSTVSREATRIASIRFVGDLGVSEPDLRRSLRLRQGDRFDFYTWQGDRERLRRFYVERGYLEAHATARRVDGPGMADRPGVVLEYEIDRGPRTILAISGYRFPDKIRHELETIWSNAVFDEARLADLRRHLGMHLIDEGYLRAEVVAGLEPPGASEEKRIRIDIVPGLRSASREIRFAGNDVVPTDRLNTLVSELDLDTIGWWDPAAVARNVEALYHNEGMLAAKIAAGPAEFVGEGAALPVTIDEGRVFSIAQVAVSGARAMQEEDVRRALGVGAGAAYLPQQVETGRRTVEAEYRRKGFNAARATVQPDVDLKGAVVHVTVRIDEGSQQVLRAVAVQGAEGVRPEVVDEALKLAPGDPVDMAAWYQARRRLLDTGLFRRVEVEAVPAEQPLPTARTAAAQPVTAQVILERWPAWRFRYGAEMTDEAAPAGGARRFGAGITADALRRTLFGRAAALGVSARWNTNQRIARGFLSVPTFFRRPLSSSLFLSRSRERISEEGFLAFITDKTTLTAEQRFKAGRRLQISYGYQFERNHTFDPARKPNDPFGLDLTVREARLTSTALVDTRDDPFSAARGLLHSSSFEYAPEALGSDVRFVRYLLQQFFYRPFGGSLVSASAVRIGVGRGFGQDLIPNERFFAGGVNTVRGYGENSLGAHDFFGTPRGGQGLIVLNQEARFPLFRWMRGVGFVDAGNVFAKAGELSFTNLKVGAGAGLRFATPFGLFRFDVGVPLSREHVERTPRFYFSLGQLF